MSKIKLKNLNNTLRKRNNHLFFLNKGNNVVDKTTFFKYLFRSKIRVPLMTPKQNYIFNNEVYLKVVRYYYQRKSTLCNWPLVSFLQKNNIIQYRYKTNTEIHIEHLFFLN